VESAGWKIEKSFLKREFYKRINSFLLTRMRSFNRTIEGGYGTAGFENSTVSVCETRFTGCTLIRLVGVTAPFDAQSHTAGADIAVSIGPARVTFHD
jgi:hypothetical protein